MYKLHNIKYAQITEIERVLSHVVREITSWKSIVDRNAYRRICQIDINKKLVFNNCLSEVNVKLFAGFFEKFTTLER